MPLHQNQVLQGDCVELLSQLEDGTADLVFADPPFNIGYDYDVYQDSRLTEDYLNWCRQWIQGVHRVLKADGTFWLAIGDEFAAELKIEAQRIGFHCRSWVIWYYTFGVNCANGFSRSHTHLFHFVKDPRKFTFNRVNPEIRVKSARQLVYADNRANPDGRLPDNTWITRPQDAPFFLSFNPSHDTWYFARVAGTFKEREGFHGCQMPEQLLARIIRASSNPLDLVLDPFGGSGTTMSVAKKLGRRWMGFELSSEYASYIDQRLEKTAVGDPIDGPEDPIQSAPQTAQGKRKKPKFTAETEQAVIQAYQDCGLPADHVLCDKALNLQFTSSCKSAGLGGNAYVWNRYLLRLRKSGKLPRAQTTPTALTSEEMEQMGIACEVAWRLLAIDYRRTLDDILCSPAFADEFDRLATALSDLGQDASFRFRKTVLSIRKRSKQARKQATERFSSWTSGDESLQKIAIGDRLNALDGPGVFALTNRSTTIYVGESSHLQAKLEPLLANDTWRKLEPDTIHYVCHPGGLAERYALKSAIAARMKPLLNCRLLLHASEFPDSPRARRPTPSVAVS